MNFLPSFLLMSLISVCFAQESTPSNSEKQYFIGLKFPNQDPELNPEILENGEEADCSQPNLADPEIMTHIEDIDDVLEEVADSEPQRRSIGNRLLRIIYNPDYLHASLTKSWSVVVFGPLNDQEIHHYVRLGNEGWDIGDQFDMEVRLSRFFGLNFKTVTMATEMYVWDCPENGCDQDQSLSERIMNGDTGEVGDLRAQYNVEWRRLGFGATVYPFKTNAISAEAGIGVGCIDGGGGVFGDVPFCNRLEQVSLRFRPGFNVGPARASLNFEAGYDSVVGREGRWTGIDDKANYEGLGGPNADLGEERLSHGSGRLTPFYISVGGTIGVSMFEVLGINKSRD